MVVVTQVTLVQEGYFDPELTRHALKKHPSVSGGARFKHSCCWLSHVAPWIDSSSQRQKCILHWGYTVAEQRTKIAQHSWSQGYKDVCPLICCLLFAGISCCRTISGWNVRTFLSLNVWFHLCWSLLLLLLKNRFSFDLAQLGVSEENLGKGREREVCAIRIQGKERGKLNKSFLDTWSASTKYL